MAGTPFSSHGLAMKKSSRLQTAEQARVGRVSSGISHRDIAGGQLGVTGARELSSDPSHAPEPLLTCFTGYSKSAGAARSPSRARIPPLIGALESPREGSGGVWWKKEDCGCFEETLRVQWVLVGRRSGTGAAGWQRGGSTSSRASSRRGPLLLPSPAQSSHQEGAWQLQPHTTSNPPIDLHRT